MARRTIPWILSLQLTLYFVLIFVRGNEDTEDAYRNGRNLALEYFLPINLPNAEDVAIRREKRDVEGSGEEDLVFGELKEKSVEDADNSTRNSLAKLILKGDTKTSVSGLSVEGSGEIEEVSESLKEVVPIIGDSEVFTTTESDEVIKTTQSEVLTEMIFDKSEDFNEIFTTQAEQITTTTGPIPTVISIIENDRLKTTTLSGENTTELLESSQNEPTTPTIQETTTVNLQTAKITEETTLFEETTTIVAVDMQTNQSSGGASVPTTTEEVTTPLISTSVPHKNISDPLIPPTTTIPAIQKFPFENATEGLPVSIELLTTPDPIVEEIFKKSKIDKNLEALPGSILEKENLSLAADPLLITNTRLIDSEEDVQLSSSEPKRIGAYIVIGLILLSFSSLVGYITFKKRMYRKRQEFESNQESNDTEKALLSLSDYKDNSELEENHLKNNEITPIVVKSNSQINKFEKNTNFSSPKNLNTIANEKNIEKDNVLKSTAENLTQVIIEDSPKDLEEDKNVPAMEKLIVKTRIDQDSIPKKPIIINRSSTGYLPIPQDNS